MARKTILASIVASTFALGAVACDDKKAEEKKDEKASADGKDEKKDEKKEEKKEDGEGGW